MSLAKLTPLVYEISVRQPSVYRSPTAEKGIPNRRGAHSWQEARGGEAVGFFDDVLNRRRVNTHDVDDNALIAAGIFRSKKDGRRLDSLAWIALTIDILENPTCFRSCVLWASFQDKLEELFS